MMLPSLSQLSFWVFAALMVFGALGVVLNRSIVYSALCLLVSFLAIAGIFVMLNAPFIAAAQILVYGVGLTIVMIFGIMLTGDKPFVDPVGQHRPKRYTAVPFVIALGVTAYFIWAVLLPNVQSSTLNVLFNAKIPDTSTVLTAINLDGGISLIAQLIFGKYMVAFELASILLLLATVGAVLLSKKDYPEEEGLTPLGRVSVTELEQMDAETKTERALEGVH